MMFIKVRRYFDRTGLPKSSILAVVVMMSVFALIAAADTEQSCPEGPWEYSSSPALYAYDSFPLVTPFKAYEEEVITFFYAVFDHDTKRCANCTTMQWDDPHIDTSSEQTWSIVGKVYFVDINENPLVPAKTQVVSNFLGENVFVKVEDTFSDNDTITVTVSVDDTDEQGAVQSNGNTGSDDDGAPAVSGTWTVTYKDVCPAELDLTDPAVDPHGEKGNPSVYTYQADPCGGRPCYESVSIHEAFAPRTSNMDDTNLDTFVKQDGLDANPGWTSADWLEYFFGGEGRKGTFVLDADDKMSDRYEFTFSDPDGCIRPDAPDLWLQMIQKYSSKCDGVDLDYDAALRFIRKANGDEKVSKGDEI